MTSGRREPRDVASVDMTADTVVEQHGIRMLMCASDGPAIGDDDAALGLIGDAFGHEADMVVVPVGRLPDEFFDLRTRVAGGIVQKFVNYRLRLVIVGDITRHVAGSAALGDFVREANRGSHLWFVATRQELAERLAGSRPATG